MSTLKLSRLPLIAGLAIFASCGNPTAKSDDPLPAETASETPMPVEPDGGIGDGAQPLPALQEAQAGAIPASFNGVWDYEGGTCARESDMRMEISASEILFYESIGTVTGVDMEGEDAVVSLDMEGEGETWTQKIRLSLSGEGDDERLATSDGEQPKVKDEYPSKRCPA